jgi:phosphonoacetaldehyde hydrolase
MTWSIPKKMGKRELLLTAAFCYTPTLGFTVSFEGVHERITILSTQRKGISLVVADMAGTLCDYGSSAPAAAFVELFKRHGIVATDAEARVPMGLQKRDHVETMLRMDSVAAQWAEKSGNAWTETDLDALYAEFIGIQLGVLPDYTDLIPGIQEAVTDFHEHGIAVAGTTGYDTEMMGIVVAGLADQGVKLDAAICATDVASGRPAPWMIFRAMEATQCSPPHTVVKIGDTLPDVEAGMRAGVWSIGVTDTGNMAGCNKAVWEALSDSERVTRRDKATEEMKKLGAHYVLTSVVDLPDLIREIDQRIFTGETP